MSQEQQLPKFDKIYKALDHCVENKVFTQITTFFKDSYCGRCVNGAIISYFNGYDFEDYLGANKIREATNGKIKYNHNEFYRNRFYTKKPTKENIKKLCQEMLQKEGYINAGILADLNNGFGGNKQWTFKDFADLFRELDI